MEAIQQVWKQEGGKAGAILTDFGTFTKSLAESNSLRNCCLTSKAQANLSLPTKIHRKAHFYENNLEYSFTLNNKYVSVFYHFTDF